MKKRQNHKKSLLVKQVGLTLTELLVSLALSTTLVAGVIEVFVGMRQTDTTQEAVSRMQEAGRFGLNFLTQEVRMAGYIGCSSTLDIDLINNTLIPANIPNSFQPQVGIQGWEANSTDPGQVNNSVNNEAVVSTNSASWVSSGGNVKDDTNAVPGTDILKIWSASGDGTNGTLESATIAAPGGSTVVNVSNLTVSSGEILVLSDCIAADVIQACVVGTGTVTTTLDLTLSNGCAPGNQLATPIRSAPGPGSKVVKLGGTMYYIGKRGNVATNPPALFRTQLSTTGIAGAPEELVEGIEDMQILYGENTNNDSNNAADRYVPADNVTTWANVVSVRLSLLVQSIGDNLVPSPVAYSFNNVLYDGTAGNGNLPADNRLRRVFTTTIGLRNRTL